jgi:hypothetical protein
MKRFRVCGQVEAQPGPIPLVELPECEQSGSLWSRMFQQRQRRER